MGGEGHPDDVRLLSRGRIVERVCNLREAFCVVWWTSRSQSSFVFSRSVLSC